ncbi:MAG: hypothetical protein DWQ34_09405 [Planctomycetota bacterium]|nr:MAG: hypothetical protein DWQ29_22540 [Planctomycetota bacterium]REJ93994.1 MAG: hypothetical protein DWQ34_09405 [Planctomycetota bacterium]REK20880.1 MAG: hypothetical protein DWQ41_23530 [Planctomycetota bacterium]REK32790.1 MAG: hypothetical protein DWQ45_16395 [Planctomycetota bacterium]
MGLLSRLFGQSARPAFSAEADQIFLTADAKWRALAKAVRARRNDGERVLILAHFPATLREARDRLAASEIATEIIDRPLSGGGVPELFERRASAEAVLAPVPALTVDEHETQPTPPFDMRVAILSLEVHPADEVEQDVLRFAASIPCATRLFPFVSLEDPLLAQFAGPAVQDILRKLGMQEDEAIQSGMVSRRVRRAQARMSSRITSWAPADSAEEWIAKNVESESST